MAPSYIKPGPNGPSFSFGALLPAGPPLSGPNLTETGLASVVYSVRSVVMPACPGIPVTLETHLEFECTNHAYDQGNMGPDDTIIGIFLFTCKPTVSLCCHFLFDYSTFYTFDLQVCFFHFFSATLNPFTQRYHSSDCERGTARGTQCEACKAVRRKLNARFCDVWDADPDNIKSLRKMRVLNLRLQAKLSNHSDVSTHDENRKFANELYEGLKQHPEFVGSLAYNVMKAQMSSFLYYILYTMYYIQTFFAHLGLLIYNIHDNIHRQHNLLRQTFFCIFPKVMGT
jgi:hypothetical protein